MMLDASHTNKYQICAQAMFRQQHSGKTYLCSIHMSPLNDQYMEWTEPNICTPSRAETTA